MPNTDNLAVVRSNKIEAGKRYLVAVHLDESRWMIAREVPNVPLSKMKPEDKFVFETAGRHPKKLELHIHGTGGPQFLVARVPALRGEGLVNSRVTFFGKIKETTETAGNA